MSAVPCPRKGCTYKYHPTGLHSYQADNPRTEAEWAARGIEVAVDMANRYRRQMYRLGTLPATSPPDAPLSEWTTTDKINMRDAAVGLIGDLCRLMAEMGEGNQVLVEWAAKRGFEASRSV